MDVPDFPRLSEIVELKTVPADKAFPEPCCYQLELRAWKRTVVSCNHGYAHCNLSEYTLGVGVCPPEPELPFIEANVERVARGG